VPQNNIPMLRYLQSEKPRTYNSHDPEWFRSISVRFIFSTRPATDIDCLSSAQGRTLITSSTNMYLFLVSRTEVRIQRRSPRMQTQSHLRDRLARCLLVHRVYVSFRMGRQTPIQVCCNIHLCNETTIVNANPKRFLYEGQDSGSLFWSFW